MGNSFAVQQPNPTQNIMKLLVTLAFLLAVATLVKSDACAGTDTEAKCLESFDEYKFIKPYVCSEECENCNLCDGSGAVSVCQYCVEGPGMYRTLRSWQKEMLCL